MAVFMATAGTEAALAQVGVVVHSDTRSAAWGLGRRKAEGRRGSGLSVAADAAHQQVMPSTKNVSACLTITGSLVPIDQCDNQQQHYK